MVNALATDGEFHPAICRMNTTGGITTAIHQPNYIPWLGYFFKLAHVDKFVFLDTVAYSSGSFVNRNSIKTPTGPAWLTIPVLTSGRSGQLISQVEADNTHDWPQRHLTTLRCNYSKAPYFKETFALLEPHYTVRAGGRRDLADFNIDIINLIASYLGLKAQCVRTSELKISGHKTDLILDICRAIGAKTYLAGMGSKSYQEDHKFADAGITPIYSCFSQRSYPQRFGEFIGNLSIVDVLMNCGYLGTRRLLDLDTEPGTTQDIKPRLL